MGEIGLEGFPGPMQRYEIGWADQGGQAADGVGR